MITTIEEKAQRYDEAYKKVAIRFGSNVADEIFPELKESEDDRIRKALINGFNKLDKSAVWYNGITNGQILAWLEKQGEQKPAWSEEDEKILDDTIELIEKANHPNIMHSNGKPLDFTSNINFLRSLKDRVQPKVEWSEKDEKFINEIEESLLAYKIIVMDNDRELANYIEKEINWLKSLKGRVQPQSKQEWKPSYFQIEALESATENCAYSEYQDCLRELIEQLKKLKD